MKKILDDRYLNFKTKKINNTLFFTLQFSTNVKSPKLLDSSLKLFEI